MGYTVNWELPTSNFPFRGQFSIPQRCLLEILQLWSFAFIRAISLFCEGFDYNTNSYSSACYPILRCGGILTNKTPLKNFWVPVLYLLFNSINECFAQNHCHNTFSFFVEGL
jgi:hypothetical protein